MSESRSLNLFDPWSWECVSQRSLSLSLPPWQADSHSLPLPFDLRCLMALLVVPQKHPRSASTGLQDQLLGPYPQQGSQLVFKFSWPLMIN